MPNGWFPILLVMGEKEIISVCIGQLDLFFFFFSFNKIKPLKGWVELC